MNSNSSRAMDALLSTLGISKVKARLHPEASHKEEIHSRCPERCEGLRTEGVVFVRCLNCKAQ